MPRPRCSVLISLGLAVTVLGAPGAASASGAPAQVAAASDSPLVSPCNIGAGPRFRCGRITVPAVRGEPSLGDQSIFFAVWPLAKKPPVGTIFAVEGGPGYASTNFDSAKSFRDVFRPLLRRRDLVLIDQRGTGHSQAVNCAQLQRGMVPEQIAVASCANQLGPRYQGFTSAESAADIEAVRTALGVGPITLYGDSYGTLLSQAYSVRYPGSLARWCSRASSTTSPPSGKRARWHAGTRHRGSGSSPIAGTPPTSITLAARPPCAGSGASSRAIYGASPESIRAMLDTPLGSSLRAHLASAERAYSGSS